MSKFLAVGLLALSLGAVSAYAAGDTPPPADPSIEQVPAAMADWFGKSVDGILEPAANTPADTEPAPTAAKHHRTEKH